MMLQVSCAALRDGLVLLVAMVSVVVSVPALHQVGGLVRLPRSPHAVIRGPLALWPGYRPRDASLPHTARAVTAVFLPRTYRSPVFDVIDVARGKAGNRESMLREGAAQFVITDFRAVITRGGCYR